MKKVLKRVVVLTLSAVIACSCYLIFGGTVKKDNKRLLAELVAYDLFNYREEYDKLPSSIQDEIKKSNASLSEDTNLSLDSYYMKGLDGQDDFILVTGEDCGYAVFDKESLQLLEYSSSAKEPYNGINKDNAYYGGIAQYFSKKGESFVNLKTNDVIPKEKGLEISRDIKTNLSQSQEASLNSVAENAAGQSDGLNSTFNPGNESELDRCYRFQISSKKFIDKSFYFELLKAGKFGRNYKGTCVTVATQILLGYNNWANDGRLINNTDFYERQSDLPYDSANIGTKEQFYRTLLSYIDSDENGAEMSDAKYGIKKYLEDYRAEIKNEFEYDYRYASDEALHNTIQHEINADRPAIISISYYDDEGNLGGHAVVGYGYQTVKINDTYNQGYVAHFGWGDDDVDLWFNKSWVKGYVIFRPLHTHIDTYINATDTHILKCSVCNRLTTDPNHMAVGRPEAIYKTYNGDIDENYHNGVCYCGYKFKKVHYLNYRKKDDTNHRAICDCGYSRVEYHYYKNGDTCFYCEYSLGD